MLCREFRFYRGVSSVEKTFVIVNGELAVSVSDMFRTYGKDSYCLSEEEWRTAWVVHLRDLEGTRFISFENVPDRVQEILELVWKGGVEISVIPRLLVILYEEFSKVSGAGEFRLDKVVELVQQGKVSPREVVEYIKKTCRLVKKLVLEYPLEKRDLFLQVTLPEKGDYLVWIVARRGGVV